MCLEEKLEKLKALHTSNFLFWILSVFVFGLGIGILLPMYNYGSGWIIIGWMLIVFAIILSLPAKIAMFHKKKRR